MVWLNFSGDGERPDDVQPQEVALQRFRRQRRLRQTLDRQLKNWSEKRLNSMTTDGSRSVGQG